MNADDLARGLPAEGQPGPPGPTFPRFSQGELSPGQTPARAVDTFNWGFVQLAISGTVSDMILDYPLV